MVKKTVLITGSSKGLGKCLALEFSRKYNIILHGRDKKSLEGVTRQIKASGMDYDVIMGDITSENVLESLAVKAKRKNIDILINNAGIYLNQEFGESYEDFKRIMDVNFLAPVRLIQKILPFFVKKGSGLIVNINSVAGKRGSKGESAYCASKHALKGFSDSLKYEVTGKGIRIIDFYLGAMATQMVKGRKNPEMCIQPKDAARFIFGVCNEYPSLNPDEININRRKYE